MEYYFKVQMNVSLHGNRGYIMAVDRTLKELYDGMANYTLGDAKLVKCDATLNTYCHLKGGDYVEGRMLFDGNTTFIMGKIILLLNNGLSDYTRGCNLVIKNM